MKLQKIIHRIQRLHRKEIDLSLYRVKLLCKKLGNPQDKLKCIQVCGTNGKYSTIQALKAILNNANIGKNCIIGAKALITENKKIPDNSLVIGSPGKVVREITEEEKKAVLENTKHYQDNWKKFSKSIF